MRTRTPQRFALWLAGLLLPLLLLGGVADAQDQKAQAKQHFSAGEARFKAGDYRAAITEFAAADALVPSPILSYNIGLCHERLGEDELAAQRYRDYLVRRPDASNRAQVEERIAAAEQRAAAARKAAAPPPPAPVPVGPPAPAPAPAPTPAPPVEGPAAPRPPVEGPAAPGPAVDPALGKRLPPRPAPGAPAPAATDGATLGALAPQPYPGGDAELAPASTAPATSDTKGTKKARPLYKEWWFWAVVGVSAIIVIDMLDDSGSSSEVQSGPVLLRF